MVKNRRKGNTKAMERVTKKNRKSPKKAILEGEAGRQVVVIHQKRSRKFLLSSTIPPVKRRSFHCLNTFAHTTINSP